MRRIACHTLVLALSGAAAHHAAAQAAVNPANKFSWQESTGWMNWADAPQPVQYRTTYLQGWIWCENIGWLNLGGGLPPAQTSYANTNGANFGVNIALNGELSGFAWSENTGWVNFAGGSLAAPPQPARFERTASRLRGFAWGENVGWVNLDLAASGQFVAFQCYANCDGSTGSPLLSPADFTCFLGQYRAGAAYANCDGSTAAPLLSPSDFTCFLARYRAGCP